MNGRIIHYFSDRGFGFIMGEDGVSRFFHISRVSKSDIPFIEDGERVQFTTIQTPKGQNAVDVALTSKKAYIDMPTFISFGSTRIRVKNIKNYGLTYETVAYTVSEEVPCTLEDRIVGGVIGAVGVFSVAVGAVEALIDGDSGDIVAGLGLAQAGFSDKRTVTDQKERERAVLYVTTYQGDNFRFDEETSDFDVKEKLKEMDSFLAS